VPLGTRRRRVREQVDRKRHGPPSRPVLLRVGLLQAAEAVVHVGRSPGQDLDGLRPWRLEQEEARGTRQRLLPLLTGSKRRRIAHRPLPPPPAALQPPSSGSCVHWLGSLSSHSQPTSTWQWLQPSSRPRLASSHSSPGRTRPSPHIGAHTCWPFSSSKQSQPGSIW